LARLLVLLLLLSACAPPRVHRTLEQSLGRDVTLGHPPFPWTVECGLDEVTHDEIRSGFAYWEQVWLWRWGRGLPDRMLFHEAELCDPIRLYDAPGDGKIYVYVRPDIRSEPDGEICGYTDPSVPMADGGRASIIQVSRHCLRRSSHNLRVSVMRHEIGHALGLPHGEDRDCLMSPDISETSVRDGPQAACAEEMDAVVSRYRDMGYDGGTGGIP
jgi:hypothetical protein